VTSSPFRLDGKVAVVTGASSGLGLATAMVMAQAGADLVLGARRVERLEQVAAQIEALGRRALVVPTDVSIPAAATTLVQRAHSELGHVDVLVNNAGIGTAVPATRETPEQWQQVLDVNLSGAYWCAQEFGRLAPPGSSIVNISSVLALRSFGMPQAAYAASKAGLLGMTRDLAFQWGNRKGIRVNAVAPGLIPTEMSTEYPEGTEQAVASVTALGRVGIPEEVAHAVLFLASDAAAYITGITLAVDGGLTLH
jgi:NAD(P)-dependent dehydrogenase (short-subunit alcohol dehydrogenase family)